MTDRIANRRSHARHAARTAAFVVAVFAMTPAAGAQGARARAADLVLTGGRIFTSDSLHPWAQAIAVRGDRVVAVGSDGEVARLAGPRTRRVALQGRVVIPGINDAHDHVAVASAPFGVAIHTSGDPVGGAPMHEVLDSLRALAARTPKGTWLRGDLGMQILGDPAARRDALDAVTPDHPVMLWAPWGHGTIVNTAALRALGIREDVKDPPVGGWYERDATGRLTGSLQEYVAWEAQRRLYSSAPDSTLVRLFREYATDRMGYGVTSVQAMMGHFDPRTTVRVARAAKLPIRLRVIPYPVPSLPGRGMAEWRRVPSHPAPNVVIEGVKYALDGTPIEQLALERRAYRGRPGWYGRLDFPVDTIRAILRDALTRPEPVMLHIVGDSTTVLVLSMMESMAPDSVWRQRRLRIEHGRGVTGPVVARAARLGVVIAQAREGAPLASWQREGIRAAYGSDAIPNPWTNVADAITSARRPEEAVSREQAIVMATREAAFAEHREAVKGMLRPGMLADFAVLSQDPFTVPVAEIPKTRSVLTVIGGRVAWDTGALR